MSQEQEALDKQRFGTAGGDHHAMMSDTAGFQKILEMSKREEEERVVEAGALPAICLPYQ